MLHLDAVRDEFPALASGWTLMDNAGGSAPCRAVIERVADHMARRPVQLGASYGLSVEARSAVDAGRAAAAALFGCEKSEIVLGASATALVNNLARALRPLWQEGDEVIVTDVDHETNIGAWRRLADSGIVVREWRVRDDLALHPEDLDALLGERTRLVAFTHCSNIVGSITDVAGAVERARRVGALTCVDAVAYAPHRRVDVRALGVDVEFASLYKVYGPHVGAMYVRSEVLAAARSTNHFFVPEDSGAYKLEPGGTPYELVAALPGIQTYLEGLGAAGGGGPDLASAYTAIAAHEEALVAPLLEFLREHPRVTLLGERSADRRKRVPTVSFTVEGRRSSEIPLALDARRIATRYGHFYAHRLIERLGLHGRDGVVRVSLVHYNSPEEVEGLVEALAELI